MAENLQIRLADPGEADRLAEIEAICFPPAEAASHEEVVKRMGAFPENFRHFWRVRKNRAIPCDSSATRSAWHSRTPLTAN